MRDSATIATIETYTSAAILCVAWDADNKSIFFRKNAGNWRNSGTAEKPRQGVS
jgi:hypothetical protein